MCCVCWSQVKGSINYCIREVKSDSSCNSINSLSFIWLHTHMGLLPCPTTLIDVLIDLSVPCIIHLVVFWLGLYPRWLDWRCDVVECDSVLWEQDCRGMLQCMWKGQGEIATMVTLSWVQSTGGWLVKPKETDVTFQSSQSAKFVSQISQQIKPSVSQCHWVRLTVLEPCWTKHGSIMLVRSTDLPVQLTFPEAETITLSDNRGDCPAKPRDLKKESKKHQLMGRLRVTTSRSHPSFSPLPMLDPPLPPPLFISPPLIGFYVPDQLTIFPNWTYHTKTWWGTRPWYVASITLWLT